jgi:cell division protein ZapA
LTKTIQIEIYGQRYALTGDAEEDYVKRLAQFVDENIRTLAQGMKTATLSRVAILAAINIAHQLFQSERLRQQGEAAIEERAGSLIETIEERLQPM